jgi:hypothetical protein
MELYTGPMASKQDKSEKLGGIHAGELIRQFLMKYIFSTKVIKNRPNFTTLSQTLTNNASKMFNREILPYRPLCLT